MAINNDSRQDLEDFKSYIIAEKNFSKHTAKAYCSDILSFLLWIDETSCENVNFEKIREYLHFIQKFNYKKTTIARKIASLRTFYKYLYRERKVNSNPAINLNAPKRPKSLPKFLTPDEVEQILNNTKIETPAGYRNRTILELLWATGMRISELSGLNFGDLNLEHNEIRVFGKGSKERMVYLNAACKEALLAYLPVRNADDQIKDKNALFISTRQHNRISKKTVQWLVKKYLEKSGLGNKHYSTHKLRHTAATLMYRSGKVDVRVLKDILGHEQLNTTQIYTHVSNESMKNAMNENPLSSVRPVIKKSSDGEG